MEKDDLFSNRDELTQRSRLAEIGGALKRLEKQANKYLEMYVKTEDWRLFKDGFLHLNHYFRPEDLVNIQTCELSHPAASSLDAAQQKITICANKIGNQEQFNTHMTYNLTLLYDQIRANIDPTDCKQLACINIRAAHLSRLCQAGDKRCFRLLAQSNVYSKEVCKGREEESFDIAYKSCIRDIAPINLMKITGKPGN